MPDSYRFTPFVDGKRACRKCEMVKEQSEYLFNKAHGYYQGICKTCEYARRKKKKQELPEEDYETHLQWHRDYHKRKSNSIEYRTTRTMASYRLLDAEKSLEYNLSRDFVIQALISPCTYCGDKSIGLDRLDNKLGHTEENCVPCCLECNNARMDNFSHEEMFIIGKAIKQVKDSRNTAEKFLNSIKQLVTF